MPLTTIASFREPTAAHIARARLEADGIPAFVTDERVVNVQPPEADAVGAVKLRVPDEYAERARAIVAEDRSGDLRRIARELPAPGAPSACPACGSRAHEGDVTSRRPRATARGAGFAAVVWITRRRCRDCGTPW